MSGEEERIDEGGWEGDGVFVGGGWWRSGTSGFWDRDDEAVEGLLVGSSDDLEIDGSGAAVT